MSLQLLFVLLLITFGANSTKVGTMSLDHILLLKSCLLFQVIDVLGQIVINHIFVLEHLAEMMNVGRLVLAHVQEILS